MKAHAGQHLPRSAHTLFSACRDILHRSIFFFSCQAIHFAHFFNAIINENKFCSDIIYGHHDRKNGANVEPLKRKSMQAASLTMHYTVAAMVSEDK